MNIPAKKILFTGVSGFLGHHLAGKSRPDLDIWGTYFQNKVQIKGVICESLDILDVEQFKALLDQFQPDAVIHLAALSNPNYCENHPEENNQINTEAPFHLAGACYPLGIQFIYASTDLVFDGNHPPYQEHHSTNGIMAYGQAKAKTEHLLTLMYPDLVTIARLPLLYGWCEAAPNFMTNWIKSLRDGKTVNVFTDEYRTTAWAGDVIDGLILLAEKRATGIFHLGGKERLSRYDFAIEMAQAFDLDASLITPTLQRDVTMAAARPSDVSLVSEKAYELGFEPKLVKGVLEVLKEYV